MTSPLAGTRVLDLSRLLPGPYCSLVLSDLGADVVKVEDPDPGDYLREISPGMYAALNRGKRSAVVDLKTAAGAAVLRGLCAAADVLIEGFRPGVLERLVPGLLASASEAFPRLVVCSISGFGQTGPWRDRAGHDIGYLALSGVLARCGEGPVPQLPGVQLADLFGGGQQAAIAVLAALLERERTGRGRALDISMTDGVLGFVLPHLGELAAGAPPQKRGEDVLSGTRPCYRVYGCRGGGAYTLGALEPKFWQRFCAALARPEWLDRALDPSLSPEMDALFAGRTREEWDAFLRRHDCCGEPVLEPRELRGHPLFSAREAFAGALPRTFPALVPSAELPAAPAPARGEHTAEVLREWGVASER
jgi:crotonobetainyl-CoA:carnitine CoA-transferase CaiB-like acyl-CoA transferase